MNVDLECPGCGNQSAKRIIGTKTGLKCDACHRLEVPRPSYLHTYSNPWHSKLSEAKERVFERSFIEPGSGMVLDKATGKEAAY